MTTRTASRHALAVVLFAIAGCSADAITRAGSDEPAIQLDVILASAVTYVYHGNTFNQFSCSGNVFCGVPDPAFTSYTTSDFVTAVITLDAPLPANLTLHNVRTLAGFSLTMTDGHQTMTLNPSVPGEALVSTDASGNIVGPWSVFVNCCAFPNNNIFALNWPGVRGVADGGGLTVPTGQFPNTPRDQGMIFGSPGTWTTFLATPEERIEDLIEGVGALVGAELNAGQANGLTRPLSNAIRSLSTGNTAAACSQLADFVSEVNAKTPPLSAPTATALIAEADSLRATIGC